MSSPGVVTAGLSCLGWSLLAGSFLLPAPPADAAPEMVILIRHDDKDPALREYNLSPGGFRRSIAQGRLIPACFGAPTHIRTYLFHPHSSKNARSYQSAVPLGVATGVNITLALGAEDDSYTSGQRILRSPDYRGGRVVLFWEHRHMPELARGLGWNAMRPIGAEDFDGLYVLRYSPAGALRRVEHLSQAELFRSPCYRRARSSLPAVDVSSFED